MSFVLKTERLLLREMNLDDLDAMLEVLGDPTSMRFYPKPFDRTAVAGWIERHMMFQGTRGFALWGVCLLDGTLIGDCGLTPQRPLDVEEIELGWHIHPAHQRRGYATEAGRACRDWGFAHLEVARLVSMIRPENTPSEGVARNLGMTPGVHFDYKGLHHRLWTVDRP